MYNLIEYSDNYSKTPGILWKHYKDEPAAGNYGDIANFNARNNTNNSFMTAKTGNNGTKRVGIMVALKYLSNFSLGMYLINCEINLDIN